DACKGGHPTPHPGFSAARALAAAALLWVVGRACPRARAGSPTVVAAVPGRQPGRNHIRRRSVFACRRSGRIAPRRSVSAATGIGGTSSSAPPLAGAAAIVKRVMAEGVAALTNDYATTLTIQPTPKRSVSIPKREC